jgi:hypothetical protein
VIATSILSRRVLAMRNEIVIGPLVVDPTFAERLVFYAPLTFLSLVGLRSEPDSDSNLARFLGWLLATTFVFYTFVGAPQLARYIIAVMPVLAILAAQGDRRWWSTGGPRRRTMTLVAVLGLLAIDLGEPFYRQRQFSQHLLAEAMLAPALRRQRTDDLLQDLGGTPKLPIVLACESVQQRYQLDERIIVRSLDGRTDRSLFWFVHGGEVDHVGYLKRLRADVLTKPTNYDRGPGLGQLSVLDGLERQGATTVRGLSFRRLRSHGFAISETPTTTNASEL